MIEDLDKHFCKCFHSEENHFNKTGACNVFGCSCVDFKRDIDRDRRLSNPSLGDILYGVTQRLEILRGKVIGKNLSESEKRDFFTEVQRDELALCQAIRTARSQIESFEETIKKFQEWETQAGYQKETIAQLKVNIY